MPVQSLDDFDMREVPLAVSVQLVSAGCSVFESFRITPLRRRGDMYELVYVKAGQGEVWLDGQPYPIHRGSVVGCRPGVATRFRWESDGDVPMIYYAHFRATDGGTALDALFPQAAPVLSPGEAGQDLQPLFYTLMQEYSNQALEYELVCGCLLDNILLRLLRLMRPGEDQRRRPSIAELGLLARQHIDHNFREPLTLQSIADALYVSPSHLSHVFRRVNQVSPIQYLNAVRVENAKAMLRINNRAIQDVARQVGIDNVPGFNRLFRRAVGMSPSEYRRIYSHGVDEYE